MNEYSRIRNEHDRAVILAQLVQADALVAAAALRAHSDHTENMDDDEDDMCADFVGAWVTSREELWKLVGPAPEGEGQESRP